ncbi:MAG: VWA domain-containing protein [Bryobacteraceae bacterium]
MSVARLAPALLLCAFVSGQEPESPIFRTSTRLVQVDVVVKAKDAPVEGLTKDDFEVRDSGKPQKIEVFSVRAITTPVTVQPLPKGVVSNRPIARGPEPVSATVVLIDSQNTAPEDQGFARLQALKYLDRAKRNESIAVYSLDTTLHVLQEFTDDQALLRKAINGFHMTQSLNMQDAQGGLLSGLTGNGANAMRAANFQRQADINTSAFTSIALHLTGLPGRKKFIWITAAPPLTFTQDNERNGSTMTEFTNLSAQIYKPMKLMNDANVAIYPIDPRGVLVSRTDPGITTMIRLAEMTGGKAYYGDNDLTIGIEEAFNDTDLTYTLGFYPTEQGIDGSIHSITVKVNRSGADARYRKSYTSENASKPPTAKELKGTLNGWVQQPLEATEIGIQAAAVPAINKPGYYDVEVGIDPASLKLEQKNGRFTGVFEIAIVPDVENKPKGLHQTIKVNLTQERYLTALERGILVINQIRVTNSKGKLLAKKLHLVVMDQATGKTGSVRIPIESK